MENKNAFTILRTLSDKDLIEKTDVLVQREREITVEVLRHIREIEIRRLFVDLGYPSMHSYCIKRLKYSEGQAHRRLSSARLLTELPEIEKRIEDGDLNLTNLSKVQSFIRAEKSASHALSRDEKLQLIVETENKPSRLVENELLQRCHQPALLAEKFHRTSAVLTHNFAQSEITKNDLLNPQYSKFEALIGEEHQALLVEFKNLYAHDLQDNSNHSVLIFLLQKAVLYKKKKLGLIPKVTNALPPSAPKVNTTVNTKKEIKRSDESIIEKARKPLKISVKKEVWNRANACCEHIDAKSKKKCTSKYALQTDHIIAIALGGTNDPENLRLLCRAHNSRRAIKTFGIYKPSTQESL